jgi:hypothetical protein
VYIVAIPLRADSLFTTVRTETGRLGQARGTPHFRLLAVLGGAGSTIFSDLFYLTDVPTLQIRRGNFIKCGGKGASQHRGFSHYPRSWPDKTHHRG